MVFSGLQDLNADVLLLIDSCQAIPESFESNGKGVVSAITSTGFEPGLLSVAPVPGPDSFTRSLINELCEEASRRRPPGCASEVFSDISLHSNIIDRLIHYKPEPLKREDGSYMRDIDNKHVMEPYRRRTPFYRCLTRKPRAIPLVPLRGKMPTPEQSIHSTSDKYSEDQATEPSNSRNREVPCVLISVRLDPHALDEPDINAWVNMLLSMPSDAEEIMVRAKHITIENYYRSCSGLMIVKMPLDIWSLMPKHPAIMFIGYISGDNQATTINKQIESRLEARSPPEQTGGLVDSGRTVSQIKSGIGSPTSQRIGHLPIHAVSTNEIKISRYFQPSQKEKDDILEWLTPVEYTTRHSDFIEQRYPWTGKWFLDSPQFKTWGANNGQTLFCPGIPGAGKTFLTSMVVEELSSRFENDGDIGIAYIYCDFRRKDEQNVEQLLAALLKQLIRRRLSLPESVAYLYTSNKDGGTRPSPDQLLSVLWDVVTVYQKGTYLIIDGLDEIQVDDREIFISAILRLPIERGTNVLATSRPLPDIAERFKDCLSLEIRANDEDVHKSVDVLCPENDPDSSTSIKAKLVSIVDGMFSLIPSCVNSLIGKGPLISPTAYAFIYEDAMGRIESQPPDQERLAKQVLSWVACAKRPFTILELQHALSVKMKEPNSDEEEDLVQIEPMVSACVGLININAETKTIHLFHHTAKEYFKRERDRWFPHAETNMGEICVKYLSFDDFQDGFCPTDDEFEERLQQYPFYDYAAHYWGYHIRVSTPPHYNALDFLQQRSKVDASIQALMTSRKHPRSLGYSQNVPRMTALHLAAYFGFSEIDELRQISKGAGCYGLETRDSYGRTPLMYAAAEGHKATVQMLLKNSADVQVNDILRQTSLIHAVVKGNLDIIRLLLTHGADPGLRDIFNRTPLIWAINAEHISTVKLLLECGASITDGDSCGQSPLSWATWKGQRDIAHLLIDRGANPEWLDKLGRTPLSWAAERGHEDIIRLLIQTGADVNVKSKSGRTPLSWAAGGGKEASIQLLINHGARIHEGDDSGLTPLHWALKGGHRDSARILLSRGASILGGSYSRSIPFSWDDECEVEYVIQLLLANGGWLLTKA
ncbi:hypothetical protein F5Y04DRAFT_274154 [Hypomontagnella monticulosa]|nr:hypothetical protein F5Y04DRAFT_274154 [Hypomontagnella monticulosa]